MTLVGLGFWDYYIYNKNLINISKLYSILDSRLKV